MNLNPVDGLLIFLIIVWVTCLHELMHVIGFLVLKIKYNLSIIYWHHFPVAISVDSPEFDNEDYLKMNQTKQLKYTVIASLPYLLIIPLFQYIATFGYVFALLSGVIIITHGINYYLEFVDIRKALKQK